MKATVLDCGAYIGDSIMSIINTIPGGKIYWHAFEPEHENFMVIKKNPEFKDNLEKLSVDECGVGERSEKRNFTYNEKRNDGGRFSYNESEANVASLEIRSKDDLNLEVHGNLYIKMDIEEAGYHTILWGMPMEKDSFSY